MSKLLMNRELMQSNVSEVMERGFPVVSEDIGVDMAVKYLKTSPALLVEEYGRIVGILTRHDILNAQP
jgi:predicted transcriptional regulator